MQFDPPLIPATFGRRYRRFLADVVLADGREVTAHVPNSGRLTTCLGPGWPVRLSRAANPRRKLPWTLEMLHNGHTWIGVHTHRANPVALEAIAAGRIPELAGLTDLQTERPYGQRSRIDILGQDGGRRVYIEVKNVTLLAADGRCRFPDAVTERGRKHLVELTAMVAAGHRAVMLFVIQRGDGEGFGPADDIDPAYGRALRVARAAGVELLAWRCVVSPEGLALTTAVPVLL